MTAVRDGPSPCLYAMYGAVSETALFEIRTEADVGMGTHTRTRVSMLIGSNRRGIVDRDPISVVVSCEMPRG